MSSRAKVIIAASVLLLLGTILLLNRGYGELSPKGYQLAMALYAACNRKDASKLEKVAELVEQSKASGELPSADHRWLNRVLYLGRSQDWDSANQMIRQIMMDQAKET